MTKVHPTSIIDDRVELADDVEIGPFCMIQGSVKIGSGTRVLNHVSIRGPVVIGANNMLYPAACVGYAAQDRKFNPDEDGAGVVIGDQNVIREGVTIHRATGEHPTTLGHRNYLMANSHMAHDCRVGNDVMMANGALLAGHVEIQDNAILAGNCGVHQFARVGRMAIISGCQGVAQDLPPFCMVVHHRYVDALNIVGLRRAGLREYTRGLSRAFKLFFRDGHPMPTALDLIETENLLVNPLVDEFVTFIRQSKRGIVAHYSSRAEARHVAEHDAKVKGLAEPT